MYLHSKTYTYYIQKHTRTYMYIYINLHACIHIYIYIPLVFIITWSNTLQQTATQCNIRQHTSTHRIS